ncbi:MAG: hypothetical protein C5B50_14320 [Verrucomicrobia bacterium]|nr:MAG: hypothetical protein C5B50_14320 [Verrucomicrobiota bacterium]
MIRLQSIVLGCFGALAERALRRPRTTLVCALMLTLITAPGLFRLTLRTDGQALLSADAPEVHFDKAIRQEFGIEDKIVVLVRCADPDGIFNPGTLQLVRDLTKDFGKLPGLTPSNIVSLATEPGFRMRPGSFVPWGLLERPAQSGAELAQLRQDLRRIELYTGTLVSNGGESTVILVGVPEGSDRRRLVGRVQDAVAARQPCAEDIAVTGAPVAESLLGVYVLEDLGVPRKLLGGGASAESRSTDRSKGTAIYQLRLWLGRRVGLLPMVILVMVLVFFCTFRNVPATLAPLPGVLVTLVSVFGLMGWAGVPIYLTTAVVPVLLVATGVTNDIYLFVRYFNLLAQKPGVSHRQLLAETFHSLASPVAVTSLTTGIGFFSFVCSPLAPVRAFGLWAGIGVLIGLLCSLTILPAVLELLNPSWFADKGTEPQRASGAGLGFRRMAVVVVQWRWAVLAATLLITALTPMGLRRLVVQDSWIEAFAPDSEFRRVSRWVNDHYHGMHLLYLCLDASRTRSGDVVAPPDYASRVLLPGDVCDQLAEIEHAPITLRATALNGTPLLWRSQAELLRRAGTNIIAWIVPTAESASFTNTVQRAPGKVQFELALRSQLRPDLVQTNRELAAFVRERRQCAVGEVLGPYELLTTTRFMSRPNDPQARQLIPLASENRSLWDYYRLSLGPERLRQVMDTNYWRALTTVFLKDANFVDTARLLADLRSYEREHLQPKGLKLGFAGDVALSQSMIQDIVTTQMRSLGWSLGGILLVTSVLGASWKRGLYCVLPSLLAVLVKLAVMGWCDIPLGVATSMFAAMTLGIGVNCAVQLLESYAQAQANGASGPDALSQAMAQTGPPALLNTMAVSLGFAVLMLSQVPANARLGLLVVLGLVNCFIVSLLLLPVLLRWWPLRIAPNQGGREPYATGDLSTH